VHQKAKITELWGCKQTLFEQEEHRITTNVSLPQPVFNRTISISSQIMASRKATGTVSFRVRYSADILFKS